jgi:hypothetical protein
MRVLALLLSVALIGVLTLTPGGQLLAVSDGRSVWQRVSCVTCPATWLADIVSNIVLFVPFGAALLAARVSLVRAILIGAAASLAIELLQLTGVPSGRAPALADLVSNTLGTAVGAVCVRQLAALLRPEQGTAQRLRAVWTLACALMLLGSAMAMAPAMPVRAGQSVAPSVLPFTPGYGWFAAAAHDARVNGVPIAHVGSGPVIVAAPRTARIDAAVAVQGRDERRYAVPIVFVHDPSMTTVDPTLTRAHLLLAQVGPDVALSSYLMAARWGLCTPSLVSEGAFRADGTGRVQLQGRVASDVWTVQWSDTTAPASVHAATLTLSPALGWTLLQTVVPASAIIAPLLTWLWLTVWFAPLGYWTPVRPTTGVLRMMSEALAATVGLLLIGLAAAKSTSTAPLSVPASGWSVVACAGGAYLRLHLARRRTRQSVA